MAEPSTKLLRVGELARAVGKSVRAIHLYEELGLVAPAQRSSGGFRMYTQEAVERISWIIKLQVIGFSLSEIQGFVKNFEHAASGRAGAERVHDVFERKLSETRETMTQLKVIENDLVEAIAYLEACGTCAPSHQVSECGTCSHPEHDTAAMPELFAGLSHVAREGYDVDVSTLKKTQGNN